MPPKRLTNAELITAADRFSGDVAAIAESLGMSSTSNIVRRLKRVHWAPGRAQPVPVAEPSDKQLLDRTLGQVAGLAYERGLSSDALDRIYAAQRELIEAFGYPRPKY